MSGLWEEEILSVVVLSEWMFALHWLLQPLADCVKWGDQVEEEFDFLNRYLGQLRGRGLRCSDVVR